MYAHKADQDLRLPHPWEVKEGCLLKAGFDEELRAYDGIANNVVLDPEHAADTANNHSNL